uniref:Uncharacterized protein n=1 Tax=Parascaris equorum TaxID=6256 RepID=A0A914RV51_PAREQ
MADSIIIVGTAVLSAIVLAIGALFITVTHFSFRLSWLTPWPKRTRQDLLRKVFAYNPNGVEQDQFANLLHESPDSRPRHTSPSRYLSLVVP